MTTSAIRARAVRVKTPDVEAVQFDGTIEHWEMLRPWQDGHLGPLGGQELRKGDWLVRFNGPKIIRAYDDETFRSVFELTDEGSTR